MVYPFMSEPVGWYQNLRNSVSEPVEGCKGPAAQIRVETKKSNPPKKTPKKNTKKTPKNNPKKSL